MRRCPLKSQYSFCALQQPKCFKAVPCCIVCTPIRVEGKEDKCFKATHSALCREKQRAFYEGQNLQNGCVGEQKDTVDLQRASPQPTAFFPIVLTTFLQRSMCVVFDYYWWIIWGWEGRGGKEGRWVGLFLLKFGAMLGKW